MNQRPFLLKISLALFVIVGIGGVVAWEFLRSPVANQIRQYIETKNYELQKIATLQNPGNSKNVLASYAPEKDLNTFSKSKFPSNVIIDEGFPPFIRTAIIEAVFTVEQTLPVEKLGSIEFYPQTNSDFAVPPVEPDAGAIALPGEFSKNETNFGESDLVKYYVYRGLMITFAYRLFSATDRQQWLQLRNLELPSYLDTDWNFTVDEQHLTERDYAFSPMDDLSRVMIRTYFDSGSQFLPNNPSIENIASPLTKLFIKGQIAKLLTFNENISQRYALSPATLIALQNRVTTYGIFWPTKNPVCIAEEPTLKKNLYYFNCVIEGQRFLNIAVTKNYDAINDLLKDVTLGDKFEEVTLRNGDKARVYKDLKGTNEAGSVFGGTEAEVLYRIPNRDEVVLVTYQNSLDQQDRQPAIDILNYIERVPNDQN